MNILNNNLKGVFLLCLLLCMSTTSSANSDTVTLPDGSIQVSVTSPDGTVVTQTQHPDGTSSSEVKQPDGATVLSYTDTNSGPAP